MDLLLGKKKYNTSITSIVRRFYGRLARCLSRENTKQTHVSRYMCAGHLDGKHNAQYIWGSTREISKLRKKEIEKQIRCTWILEETNHSGHVAETKPTNLVWQELKMWAFPGQWSVLCKYHISTSTGLSSALKFCLVSVITVEINFNDRIL